MGRPRMAGDTLEGGDGSTTSAEKQRGGRDVWQRGEDTEPPLVYRLRVGPEYKKHKKKAPSEAQLYTPVAMDVFRSKTKVGRGT